MGLGYQSVLCALKHSLRVVFEFVFEAQVVGDTDDSHLGGEYACDEVTRGLRVARRVRSWGVSFVERRSCGAGW